MLTPCGSDLAVLMSALYFGGGTAYNRSQPRSGVRASPPLVDDIPNVEMWRALPGLVKAGIAFTVAAAGGGGKGTYSEIDQEAGEGGEKSADKKKKKKDSGKESGKEGKEGKKEGKESKSSKPERTK